VDCADGQGNANSLAAGAIGEVIMRFYLGLLSHIQIPAGGNRHRQRRIRARLSTWVFTQSTHELHRSGARVGAVVIPPARICGDVSATLLLEFALVFRYGTLQSHYTCDQNGLR